MIKVTFFCPIIAYSQWKYMYTLGKSDFTESVFIVRNVASLAVYTVLKILQTASKNAVFEKTREMNSCIRLQIKAYVLVCSLIVWFFPGNKIYLSAKKISYFFLSCRSYLFFFRSQVIAIILNNSSSSMIFQFSKVSPLSVRVRILYVIHSLLSITHFGRKTGVCFLLSHL